MRRNSITILLRGGLGNQLFQVTAGAFFAKKLKTKLILDDTASKRHNDETRRTWLRKICLQNLFTDLQLEWENPLFAHWKASKLGKRGKRIKTLDETQVKELVSLNRSLVLSDWFQSNLYLPSDRLIFNEDHLRDARKFVLERARDVRSQEFSAAIHIRLGDFKKTSWGILPRKWYQNAVLSLIDTGISSLDCFSDDIFEAREILKDIGVSIKINFVEENVKLMPHELLFLMSQYRYFISSNSTLSWWSSYLNQRENSEIICPWSERLILPSWKLQVS